MGLSKLINTSVPAK